MWFNPGGAPLAQAQRRWACATWSCSVPSLERNLGAPLGVVWALTAGQLFLHLVD